MMQNETRDGLTVQSDRRWAMIDQGVVQGVILWDGDHATFAPPMPVLELDPNSPVGPGWHYDGATFSLPDERNILDALLAPVTQLVDALPRLL